MKLRFSVREWFLVTAIIAMGICWWFDHQRWYGYFHEAMDRGSQIAKERDDMETRTNAKMKDIFIRERKLEDEKQQFYRRRLAEAK